MTCMVSLCCASTDFAGFLATFLIATALTLGLASFFKGNAASGYTSSVSPGFRISTLVPPPRRSMCSWNFIGSALIGGKVS